MLWNIEKKEPKLSFFSVLFDNRRNKIICHKKKMNVKLTQNIEGLLCKNVPFSLTKKYQIWYISKTRVDLLSFLKLKCKHKKSKLKIFYVHIYHIWYFLIKKNATFLHRRHSIFESIRHSFSVCDRLSYCVDFQKVRKQTQF